MNFTQAYVSRSLVGLDFRKKYGLAEYYDSSKPLVIFGMYDQYDLSVFNNHKSDLCVVWQGMDAKTATNDMISELKKKACTHYSISHWIKNTLELADINSFYSPISATIGQSNPVPRGNNVYFYGSNLSDESNIYYGGHLIDEIEDRTGLKIIRATYETYSKDDLVGIYESCFVNLRLTEYDGCPNTNLEMGLMGRRSIYNGDIPGSIKWRGVSDICDSIMREYYRRHDDNKDIADITSIFVNSTNNIFR